MFYDDGARSFELPRMTISLQERYDAARGAQDARESARLKLQLMCEALGEGYVADRCGESHDVGAVDVAELDALFIDVSLAYGMRGLGEVSAVLSQLSPLLDQIERINAIAGDVKPRQGFKRVL